MCRGLPDTVYHPMKKIKNDMMLAGAILLIALAAFGIYLLFPKEGNTIIVSVDGKEQYLFSLEQEITQTVQNETGDLNTVVIQEGKVSVSDANCPDGICVAHHPISKVGESIVCLPHKLVVSVEENK